MKTRILTAIVALCLFVPVCIFSDTWVFPIAFAVLSLVGVHEMISCIGMKSAYLYTVPAYLFAIGAPILAYCRAETAMSTMLLLQFVLMIYILFMAVVRRGRDKVTDLAVYYMTSFYVIVSFASVVLLRMSENGNYLYLLAFIGPWVSDTFAWLCGRLFGKHKLIPEVSPKKTVEGAVGGVVFAGLAFALYGFLVSLLNDAVTPNYVLLAVAGVICAIVSQFGDLIASFIKRQYGVKDYGSVFPGHGGVMDRFDSVLLAAPILYLVLTYIPSFVLF